MTLKQIFIANLKKYRKLSGLSQMSLAELCDMGGNYISQIEMGRRLPSFETIEKIAKALKIPPSHLFIDENATEIVEDMPLTKDYLGKMPAKVKKEIITRLLVSIKSDIISILDPKKYDYPS